MTRGDGQDLVEYGLVVGMLALTLTASSQTFAVVITTTFTNLATGFTNAV
jgi:Flp pilus assembly pilin Flp